MAQRPTSSFVTELSLAVVGIDFPNPDKSRSNRRFEIALCRPGDPVELGPADCARLSGS